MLHIHAVSMTPRPDVGFNARHSCYCPATFNGRCLATHTDTCVHATHLPSSQTWMSPVSRTSCKGRRRDAVTTSPVSTTTHGAPGSPRYVRTSFLNSSIRRSLRGGSRGQARRATRHLTKQIQGPHPLARTGGQTAPYYQGWSSDQDLEDNSAPH